MSERCLILLSKCDVTCVPIKVSRYPSFHQYSDKIVGGDKCLKYSEGVFFLVQVKVTNNSRVNN